MQEMGCLEQFRQQFGKLTEGLDIPSLEEELGMRPVFDVLARLYRPDAAHEEAPKVEGENGVYRIRVGGVVVRYVESMHCIQMTVEGDLPQPTIDALTSDLRSKFSALENTPCELRQL